MVDQSSVSDSAAVTMRARKGRTQITRIQVTLFALTALLLLKEKLATIMSSHSFLYLGSPGISVLGNLFPEFRSYVASV